MSKLFFDVGKVQLTKFSEELCGDRIITSTDNNRLIAVLSDGLGSGVKANILATLSSKIISEMAANNCDLEDIVATLAETLPLCHQRKLAYSTFSILEINEDGKTKLIEYDNPPTIFIRNYQQQHLPFDMRKLKGKKIFSTQFQAKLGDTFVLLSDGALHAGPEKHFNQEWTWQRIADFVRRLSFTPMSAQEIADEIQNVTDKLYQLKPADDASAIVVKLRKKRTACIMVGPPVNPDDDNQIVKNFLQHKGLKIACGGTTSNIISRYLQTEIKTDYQTVHPEIPPLGYLDGIDFCTEGIITLSHAHKLLQKKTSYKKLELATDAASKLAQTFHDVDQITFFIGEAFNTAYRQAGFSHECQLKAKLLQEIIEFLQREGKQIQVQYH